MVAQGTGNFLHRFAASRPLIFSGEQPIPFLLTVERTSMRIPVPYLYGIRLPLTYHALRISKVLCFFGIKPQR